MKKNIDFFKILALFSIIGVVITLFAFLGAYFILKKGTFLFMIMAVLTCCTAIVVFTLVLKNKISIASPGKMKDRKTQILMGISAIIIGISGIYITATKSQLTILDIIFSGLFILGGIGLILKEPEKTNVPE